MAARVLVVEDSATQAQMLRLILNDAGFEVDVASDGREGFERARRGGGKPDVDIVLSDIVMPGLNGYDMCRAIKGNPDTRQIPVVLLTTQDEPEDIVKGLEAGADNYILKPYDPEGITHRVNAILERDEARSRRKSGGRKWITADRGQLVAYLTSALDDLVANRQREFESKRAAEVVLRMRDQFL